MMPIMLLPHESHTKFSTVFNIVILNPNDTPNCLSVLSSRLRSAIPLILAPNVKEYMSTNEKPSILYSS